MEILPSVCLAEKTSAASPLLLRLRFPRLHNQHPPQKSLPPHFFSGQPQVERSRTQKERERGFPFTSGDSGVIIASARRVSDDGGGGLVHGVTRLLHSAQPLPRSGPSS